MLQDGNRSVWRLIRFISKLLVGALRALCAKVPCSMLRKSPLKRKRETPRRNEGRITHARTKRKAGSPPDAVERRHMDRVASLPCLVCGAWPVHLHHVSSDGWKRIARSHKLVTPLCPVHHKIEFGPRESVEALSHAGFLAVHGVDLLAEAQRRDQLERDVRPIADHIALIAKKHGLSCYTVAKYALMGVKR